MKIGIVGGVGSGKSDLAHGIKEYYGWGDSSVIDRYVPYLQETTELALGHFASYVENMLVAFTRRAWELENADGDTITCGTTLDTICYAAMHGNMAMRSTNAEVQRAEYARAEAAMKGLSLLVADAWQYDLVVYTPYETPVEGWDFTFDSHLPGIIEQFFIPTLKVTGSTDERVKRVIEVIEKAKSSEEPEPAPTPEPGVLASGEAGERERDPA